MRVEAIATAVIAPVGRWRANEEAKSLSQSAQSVAGAAVQVWMESQTAC